MKGKKIKDWKESDIHWALKRKVGKKAISKRARHKRIEVKVDDKVVRIFTLPNNHQRIMRHGKSKYIAGDLGLTFEKFIELIDCDLTGPQYYELIRTKLFEK